MREEEDRVEKEEKVDAEKRKKQRQERKEFMGTRTNRINAWRDWSKSVCPPSPLPAPFRPRRTCQTGAYDKCSPADIATGLGLRGSRWVGPACSARQPCVSSLWDQRECCSSQSVVQHVSRLWDVAAYAARACFAGPGSGRCRAAHRAAPVALASSYACVFPLSSMKVPPVIPIGSRAGRAVLPAASTPRLPFCEGVESHGLWRLWRTPAGRGVPATGLRCRLRGVACR